MKRINRMEDIEMKFCSRPWDYWYICDAIKGMVRPCPWMINDGIVEMGNVVEQSVDEIVNGDEINIFRKMILEGNYALCDKNLCRLIAHDSLPDLSQDKIEQIIANKYPLHFNIAYDDTCNHACPSCRDKYFCKNGEYSCNIKLINNKMLTYYNNAKSISLNGRGEVFASKELLELVTNLNPINDDFELVIETNASLFDEQHWKYFKHLEKYKISVMATVNSFNDSTYRYLNGYSNHVEQVIKNLYYIQSLREKEIINDFTISMIVQEANFREMPVYVKRCFEEFGADKVRIRGIMKFAMNEEEFWYKDVFNPAHPCYSEVLDILDNPIMKDSRIWYWEGDYRKSRENKEHPLQRYKDYYLEMTQLKKMEKTDSISDICKRLVGKRIAIYGGNIVGKYLYDLIKKECTVICILDKSNKKMDNYPVRCFDNNVSLGDIDVIVNVLPYYNSYIKNKLNTMNYVGDLYDINYIIKGQQI